MRFALKAIRRCYPDIAVIFDRYHLMARESGIRLLQRSAPSIERHRHGLPAGFKHPIWAACVEGVNNKTNVLKRKAYGYRDLEYFELKLHAANTLRYSLLG